MNSDNRTCGRIHDWIYFGVRDNIYFQLGQVTMTVKGFMDVRSATSDPLNRRMFYGDAHNDGTYKLNSFELNSRYTTRGLVSSLSGPVTGISYDEAANHLYYAFESFGQLMVHRLDLNNNPLQMPEMILTARSKNLHQMELYDDCGEK